MASIYKRKDGKGWRAVIRIKNHPTVCDHFDRKEEAEDWARDTERKIKLGQYSPNKAKEKTVADLIDLYIKDAVVDHHKAAKDSVRQLNYFQRTLGEYALAYITPELLLKERRKLSDTPTRNNTKLNPATINRYFSTLSGAFRFACKNLRWIDENPCVNLLKLKSKPKARRVLSEDEDIRLLHACRQSQSPYLYCIVLIALTTGARKSEILHLTWDAIDFDNRIAHIKDSKNGQPRRVGLVGSVIKELKKLYQCRDTIKPLVFASKTAFGKVDIKKAWHAILKRANIENFVFHGLRHHFCSIGGELGASGTQLRAQLGHSSSRMTDHYSHLEANSTRFIGESIEKRIVPIQENKETLKGSSCMKKTSSLKKQQTRKPSKQKFDLLDELRQMIESTRQSVANTINAGLTALNWKIGYRIRSEILENKRAEYGKEIITTVSQQLSQEYGIGFSEKNIRRMIQFAEVFSDEQIVVSLIRQLSWTHFIALIPLKDPLKRDFYAEMCRIEKWNVKTLRKKIDSMLYERTAISRKPELVAQAELEMLRKEDQLTPNLVFRDPYVLEFLNLNDRYLEKDLEDAIMRELEQFLLELGIGFCFVERQKRVIVDDEDFHIDLLFFHRKLKSLVAIELKIGDFKAEYKGQMELYLRWLDKHERNTGEEPPIGIILCAGKKSERVELLELDRSGIHVAEYLTSFPSKKTLQEKLHKAVARARERLEIQSEKEK